MKTIDIKGKPYVMVHERIIHFHTAKEFTGWYFLTDFIHLTDDSVCMKCEVFDQDGNLRATGHAQEFRENSAITKTSYVEVCETSAIGRALGALNIGIMEGMASAEEVATAITAQQDTRPWLNQTTFNEAIKGMNTMAEKSDREAAYKHMDETYRMKKVYREQLLSVVESVDIPGLVD